MFPGHPWIWRRLFSQFPKERAPTPTSFQNCLIENRRVLSFHLLPPLGSSPPQALAREEEGGNAGSQEIQTFEIAHWLNK